MNERARYGGMKSILEVPLLNEKYVAKAPASPADAVMLDLEDSVPTERKAEARDRAVRVLADSNAFVGKHVFVRINNLATPWGHDDLRALAQCPGEIHVCYPKVEARDEMQEVVGATRAGAGTRGVYAMIETARALIEIDRIAPCPGLVGLHFGYVDYAADVGCQLFNADGDDLHPAMAYARTKVSVAAAAYGIFATGGSMVPEFKDMAKVETFVQGWLTYGYTACMALSPSHLEIVNRVFRPSAAMIDEARRICAAFEAATAAGQLNAILEGRVITTPDYRNASQILARAANGGGVKTGT
ncbi:HpcH/HpaI aldolase/citrate lyase family protein [Paracoccus pantotrophus]|uniref:HpcH/HpaI aldolase/citrate lyase family protein n=1 Tax=Paracoccus pantotrophus TaxID=82367 RepID=UPI00048DF163|nr:CoA ester lyase [Paracoccus pantotrophus]